MRAKRLEEGTYAMPFTDCDAVRREISAQELGALLSGIDPNQAQRRKRYQRKSLEATQTLSFDNVLLGRNSRRLDNPTSAGRSQEPALRPEILQQMLVDLTRQLDKTQRLLRQLLSAKTDVRSEQLSVDQLRLLHRNWARISRQNHRTGKIPMRIRNPPAGAGNAGGDSKPRGRRQLPSHLKRERIVHDLAEEEKHCASCDQDLRPIGEEVSERYEYIPAQMLVIGDTCQKYACACAIKTAAKPAQPIEKSTAGESLLAHVILSKVADHLPARVNW